LEVAGYQGVIGDGVSLRHCVEQVAGGGGVGTLAVHVEEVVEEEEGGVEWRFQEVGVDLLAMEEGMGEG